MATVMGRLMGHNDCRHAVATIVVRAHCRHAVATIATNSEERI